MRLLCAATAAMLLSSACSAGMPEVSVAPGYAGDVAPGEMGATPGGQKDIGQARAVIAAGGVPAPDTVSVEGLLSEHDLPVDGAPCAGVFCARPQLARGRSLETGRDEAFLHVGMVSGLDPATWKRPPVDVVVVVDKSSSMSIDIRETDQAVESILDKLRPDDRFGLVVFDDAVHELVPLAPVTDTTAARIAIRNVGASGGANLMAGLRRGFELADASRTQGRLSRVMLFTCGYPDAGSTGPGSFVDLTRSYADRNVGLSVFGVVLGFDESMSRTLSSMRGGNYFFLESVQRVQAVFDEDFETVVTPLAYDLDFLVKLAPGVRVAKAYGVPGDPGTSTAGFQVATVFPSHRRGAIVLRLEADDPALLTSAGSVEVKYLTAPDLAPESSQAAFSESGREPPVGVRKAIALVNIATQVTTACARWYVNDRAAARSTVDALIAWLEPEVAALADAGLANELALVRKLRSNMN